MSLRRKRGIIWCVFGLAFLCVLALYVCPPAVQGLLTRNKYVKSYRLGEFGEGDAGVTIATFKQE